MWLRYTKGMKEKEREATEGLIESLTYFEVSKEIAKRSGEIKLRFAKKGITLTTSDAIIAAVAVTNNLILMTDNSRHFPIPELKICEL
ncbi:PIN domain-containing protein [bacterium]|nr:PIN domain-containing protein [bacterium]